MATLQRFFNTALDVGTLGLNISNWYDIANLTRMAAGGASSFFGKKSVPHGETASKEAEENKMQAGEFNAVIGILSALHTNETPSRPITEYEVKASELPLFNLVIAAMKPGARKLFIQTEGFKGAEMKRRRVLEYISHEVNGKTRQDPVTEETAETVNIDGKKIVSAIIYLATQAEGKNDKDRAKAVAEQIEGWGIFQSKADAAKELGVESAGQLKLFLGWLDTSAHIFVAIATLGPWNLQRFLDSPECERLLVAIERKKTAAAKRPLQEELQRLLLVASERVNAVRCRRLGMAFKVFLGTFALFIIAGLAVAGYLHYS